MTRFWPNGQLIHVGCDALGTPDWLVWQARRHTVAHVLERWRVDERWWQGLR